MYGQTLESRLEQAISTLEDKLNISLSSYGREVVKEGISVGYSRENTFEKAEEIIEQRMLALFGE